MTSAVERHSILIEHGWRVRLDGRMYPPPDWHDTRAYSFAAAWAAHRERSQIADRPDPAP
jgi:hypothetical protein